MMACVPVITLGSIWQMADRGSGSWSSRRQPARVCRNVLDQPVERRRFDLVGDARSAVGIESRSDRDAADLRDAAPRTEVLMHDGIECNQRHLRREGLRSGGDEAGLVGDHDELDAVACAQLREDAGYVRLDSQRTEEE